MLKQKKLKEKHNKNNLNKNDDMNNKEINLNINNDKGIKLDEENEKENNSKE